ncbi:MAG: hypothetical protein ACOYNF_11190, partial [Rhodoferax sp.]
MLEIKTQGQQPITADSTLPARPPEPATNSVVAPKESGLVVPIRSLGENHRGRIADHLLSLDAQDRYYRFGFSA